MIEGFSRRSAQLEESLLSFGNEPFQAHPMHAGGQGRGFEAEKRGGAVGTIDLAVRFGEGLEDQVALVRFYLAE